MNILIYGNQASGKTTLANLLAKDYKTKKQKVTILDNFPYETRSGYLLELKLLIEQIQPTLGNPNKHTICVTQGAPNNIYGFYDTEERSCQWDYKIHTVKAQLNKGE